MEAWSCTEAIAGSSHVAKIAVSSVKVSVVLPDVRRSLVKIRYRMGPNILFVVSLLQVSL
jgi:hypothetical protein